LQQDKLVSLQLNVYVCLSGAFEKVFQPDRAGSKQPCTLTSGMAQKQQNELRQNTEPGLRDFSARPKAIRNHPSPGATGNNGSIVIA
jgi:hypothetical protein